MNPILATTLTIDIIGIIVGLTAIFTLLQIKQEIGGEIGKGLTVFIGGLIFMILAFAYTVVFTRLKLLAPPTIDVHHALMTIGMILFILSANRFAKTINK